MTVHCKLHIEIAPNLLIDEVDNNSDGTLKKVCVAGVFDA
jgi:hypothetical protein